MGGPQKFVIPDYKKYTVGKHTPELLQLQQHLRQRGLKDPWIRTGNISYINIGSVYTKYQRKVV